MSGYDAISELDTSGDTVRGRVRADQTTGAGEISTHKEYRDIHQTNQPRQLQNCPKRN